MGEDSFIFISHASVLRKSNELTYVKASRKSTVITIFLGVILRVLHFGNVSPVSLCNPGPSTQMCATGAKWNTSVNQLSVPTLCGCCYVETWARKRRMQLFLGVPKRALDTETLWGGDSLLRSPWKKLMKVQHVCCSWEATGTYVLPASNMCHSSSHLPSFYFICYGETSGKTNKIA